MLGILSLVISTMCQKKLNLARSASMPFDDLSYVTGSMLGS